MEQDSMMLGWMLLGVGRCTARPAASYSSAVDFKLLSLGQKL